MSVGGVLQGGDAKAERWLVEIPFCQAVDAPAANSLFHRLCSYLQRQLLRGCDQSLEFDEPAENYLFDLLHRLQVLRTLIGGGLGPNEPLLSVLIAAKQFILFHRGADEEMALRALRRFHFLCRSRWDDSAILRSLYLNNSALCQTDPVGFPRALPDSRRRQLEGDAIPPPDPGSWSEEDWRDFKCLSRVAHKFYFGEETPYDESYWTSPQHFWKEKSPRQLPPSKNNHNSGGGVDHSAICSVQIEEVEVERLCYKEGCGQLPESSFPPERDFADSEDELFDPPVYGPEDIAGYPHVLPSTPARQLLAAMGAAGKVSCYRQGSFTLLTVELAGPSSKTTVPSTAYSLTPNPAFRPLPLSQ